jgi:hypothetical protein
MNSQFINPWHNKDICAVRNHCHMLLLFPNEWCIKYILSSIISLQLVVSIEISKSYFRAHGLIKYLHTCYNKEQSS